MTVPRQSNNAVMTDPTHLEELRTPALVVNLPTFNHNLAAMDKRLPGPKLRPHVKAFKSTSMARRLHDDGHRGFCAATPREIEGLVSAGLGEDLLLANETLDTARLGALADTANITVAVDSDETIDAAVRGGIRSVLIDVDVGLPRCGCDIEDAGRLADLARAKGMEIRGVMGYEGHLMMVMDRDDKSTQVQECMAILLQAHDIVGGDIVSGGGTGTFDLNRWCTEIQAGSYMLLDTQYDELESPFEKALTVLATVISVSSKGWIIADAGLKAFGMDHGNPSWDQGEVLFCSDEHITLVPERFNDWKVGDQVKLWPAHVDPTVALHAQFWIVEDDVVRDRWPIDLRHW